MFKQGGRLLRAWTRGQDICRTLHHRRVSVTKPGLDCVQAEIRNGLDIPIVGQLLCHERGHNRCQITIREPETNFYVRILFPLAPFSLFLFETTAGNFYAKNSVCGLSCDLSLQAEAEKFMEKLSD